MHIGFPTIRPVPETEEEDQLRREILFRKWPEKRPQKQNVTSNDTESLRSEETLVAPDELTTLSMKETIVKGKLRASEYHTF